MSIITNPDPLIPNKAGTLIYTNYSYTPLTTNNYTLRDINNNIVASTYTPNSLLLSSSSTMQTISSVAIDIYGNCYYSNNKTSTTLTSYTENSIYLYNPITNSTSTFISNASTPKLYNVIGLTFDTNNNLYVASGPSSGSTTTSYIYKYNSSGTYLSIFITLSYIPHGIIFDSSNNLYIVNSTNQNIMKYNSSGIFITTPILGLNNPYSIAFDSLGNIYIGNFGNNSITKYDISSLTTSVYYTLVGMQPYSIIFDSNNNLYINDFNSTKIYKITTSGDSTTILSFLQRPTGLNFYNGYLYFLVNNSGDGTYEFRNYNLKFTFDNVILSTNQYNLSIYNNTTVLISGLKVYTGTNIFLQNYQGFNTIDMFNVFSTIPIQYSQSYAIQTNFKINGTDLNQFFVPYISGNKASSTNFLVNNNALENIFSTIPSYYIFNYNPFQSSTTPTGYTYIIMWTSGNITLQNDIDAYFILIGGGGGGGSGTGYEGGGAGGTYYYNLTPIPLNLGSVYTYNIGTGGTGGALSSGSAGGSTSISGLEFSQSVTGGGGGGGSTISQVGQGGTNNNSSNYGRGGTFGQNSTATDTYSGYDGFAIPFYDNIIGATFKFGGGGGAGGRNSGASTTLVYPGGLQGGGQGYYNTDGQSGQVFTHNGFSFNIGGGGGGGGNSSTNYNNGGNGGNGIAILYYKQNTPYYTFNYNPFSSSTIKTNFSYIVFWQSCSFKIQNSTTNAYFILIGGGGGGGSGTGYEGGGAGGTYYYNSTPISLNSGDVYSIIVGNGGAGGPFTSGSLNGNNGSSGGSTSISGPGINQSVTGGGGGQLSRTSTTSVIIGQGGTNNNPNNYGRGGTYLQNQTATNTYNGYDGFPIPFYDGRNTTFQFGGGGGAGGRNCTAVNNLVYPGGLNGGGNGSYGISNLLSATPFTYNGYSLNIGGGGGGGGNTASTNYSKGGNGGNGIVVLYYSL